MFNMFSSCAFLPPTLLSSKFERATLALFWHSICSKPPFERGGGEEPV